MPHTVEMTELLSGIWLSMNRKWSNKDQEIVDHTFEQENATGSNVLINMRDRSLPGPSRKVREKAKAKREKAKARKERANGEKTKAKEERRGKTEKEKENGKEKIPRGKAKAKRTKAKVKEMAENGAQHVKRLVTPGKSVGSIPTRRIPTHINRIGRISNRRVTERDAMTLKDLNSLGRIDQIPRTATKVPIALYPVVDCPTCVVTLRQVTATWGNNVVSHIIPTGGIRPREQERQEETRINRTTCIQ